MSVLVLRYCIHFGMKWRSYKYFSIIINYEGKIIQMGLCRGITIKTGKTLGKWCSRFFPHRWDFLPDHRHIRPLLAVNIYWLLSYQDELCLRCVVCPSSHWGLSSLPSPPHQTTLVNGRPSRYLGRNQSSDDRYEIEARWGIENTCTSQIIVRMAECRSGTLLRMAECC